MPSKDMISTAFRDLAAMRRLPMEDSECNLSRAFVMKPSLRSVAECNGHAMNISRARDVQRIFEDDDEHECLQQKIRALRAAVKHARDESAKIDSFPSKRARSLTTAAGSRFHQGSFSEERSPAMVSLPPPRHEFCGIPAMDETGYIGARGERQLPSYTSVYGVVNEELHPFQQTRPPQVRTQGTGNNVGMTNASDAHIYSILEHQAAEIARLREQLNSADERFTRILTSNRQPAPRQSPRDQHHFDSNIMVGRQLLHHPAAAEANSLRGNGSFSHHDLGNAQQVRVINELPGYQSFLPAKEALRLAQEQQQEADAYQRHQLSALGILPPRIMLDGTPFDTNRTRLPSNLTGHHLAMAEPGSRVVLNARARNRSESGGKAAEPVVSAASSRPCSAVTKRSSISMALEGDRSKLSEYQFLVRQHLEFFVAQEEDAESNIQGRKKRIHLGQVGMRCRDCAHLPIHSRGRGSVYYPSKMDGIYQAAQNMATTHLNESCTVISAATREKLLSLRERRETASRRGKGYWSEACQQLGIYETEQGLRLAAPWK